MRFSAAEKYPLKNVIHQAINQSPFSMNFLRIMFHCYRQKSIHIEEVLIASHFRFYWQIWLIDWNFRWTRKKYKSVKRRLWSSTFYLIASSLFWFFESCTWNRINIDDGERMFVCRNIIFGFQLLTKYFDCDNEIYLLITSHQNITQNTMHKQRLSIVEFQKSTSKVLKRIFKIRKSVEKYWIFLLLEIIQKCLPWEKQLRFVIL